MTKYDANKLRSMTVHERHTLWINARKQESPEAKAIVEAIENLGLPYSDPKAIRDDDPIAMKIYEIIFSEDGKAAALRATQEGLPAMAYIDPMLASVLGVDYGAHNMATNKAGVIVSELMNTLGYRTTGAKRKLPEGSVAKTAEVYEIAKPLR